MEAMHIEVSALQHIWIIVVLPESKQTIGCKSIYPVKYNAYRAWKHYKACLVAKEYTQKVGTDFKEIFSFVVKMVTVWALLAIAIAHSWPLFQMDVSNAFVQGDLDDDVYTDIPEGFTQPNPQIGERTKVCKLLKSLNGQKQALWQWNLKLIQTMFDHGWLHSKQVWLLLAL